MKIGVDASELLKSLEEAKQKIKNKLEFMVQEVVYDALAVPAIDITPYGDLEKFYSLYEYRNKTFRLPMAAGLAKGGWSINFNINPNYGSGSEYVDTASGSLSKSRIQSQLDQYKLGNIINLYNATSYVSFNFNGKSLESGYSPQAPQGIRIPTIDAFMGLYKGVMQRALSNV